MPIRITGLNSGLDTESIISALVSSYSYKPDKYKKAQTKLSWKQDAWKTLNTKIYSLYKNVSNLKYSSGYSTKTATVSDATKASVSVSSSAVNGTQTLQINDIATSGYLTGSVISKDGSDEAATADTTLKDLGYTGGETTIKVTDKSGGTTTEIKITSGMTISEFTSELNNAGVAANFEVKNQRIFISSKSTGEKNDFTLKAQDDNADDALKALGLCVESTAYDTTDTASFNTDTSRIKAADAAITLNGVKFTSETNEFTVNGVSISALAKTGENEVITLTVATDAEAIYDKVKDFLSQYNSLMNEMTSLYNADSAKGFEPLTSDEKDSMSDEEVEKWESKIKASLLRRDDTLQSIMSVMQNAMSKTYSINGKNYALSSFGIKTLGSLNAAENEQYAYHIDGDEDDASTSGNEDKLLSAIKEDPDTVISFMKQLATNLYDAMDKKMKSTTLSSSYTIYNDKEMASEYSDYTDLITKWEDKLADQEDYYYDKFSAMETALAKLNSQTSSLSGLFG